MMFVTKKHKLAMTLITLLTMIVCLSGYALADGGERIVAPVKGETAALANKAEAPVPKIIAAKRWYVDGGKLFSGDGKSWARAFKTIEHALTAAKYRDQIWVKAGTYLLSAQLEITKSVKLYGGFAGTESRLSQRRPTRHRTIIDGGGDTRSMHITAKAIIDGFTIQNCTHLVGVPYDHPISVTAFHGAAMLIESADPVIRYCRFKENFLVFGGLDDLNTIRQGIVFIDNGAPVFKYCRFVDNWIESHGGQGTAIYNRDSSTEIVDCHFNGNTINMSSGAYGGSGGAIYNMNSDPLISRCSFIANEIYGNEDGGGKGGTIYNNNSPASIKRCWFKDNVVSGEDSHGGAIFNRDSLAIIENCGFYNNTCDGFFDDFDDGIPVAAGGAIYNKNSDVSIINCTLSRNHAVDWENYGHDNNAFGGGIYNESSDPTIVNSILWANKTIIKGYGGAGDIVNQYSQIYDDGASNSNVSYSDLDQRGYLGEGNMRENPLFGTALHLTAESPCRGAGNGRVAPPLDIDGEKRFTGDKATDIGFDEFIDSEKDGMPDFWERRYRLKLRVNDAKRDPDRDGWTNLMEYERGTNPRRHNGLIPGQ